MSYFNLYLFTVAVLIGSCATSGSDNSPAVVEAPSAEQKKAEALDRYEQFHFREVKQLEAVTELQNVDLSSDQALKEFKAALAKKPKNSLHALFLVFDKENSEVFISHVEKPLKKVTPADKSELIQERLQALKNENLNASYGIVIFSSGSK